MFVSSFSSAGDERSTVEVLNGLAMPLTPVSTPATMSTPAASAPTTRVVTIRPARPRRRPPSATTRTVTSWDEPDALELVVDVLSDNRVGNGTPGMRCAGAEHGN